MNLFLFCAGTFGPVSSSARTVRRIGAAWCGAWCVVALVASCILVGPSRAGNAPPWSWPIEAPWQVTRGFDPPARPWLAGHRGVDLRVSCGQVVFSPAPGTVTLARRIVDVDVMVITHDHRRSTFAPVTAMVPVGSAVAAGAPVAVVNEDCANTLHWGVKVGPDEYLNPLTQMLGRIVLKPWDIEPE